MSVVLDRSAHDIAHAVATRMLADWDPVRLGWDWGSGLAGHALLTWWQQTAHQDTSVFLRTWIDHHLAAQTPIYDRGGRLWKIGPGTCVLHFWADSQAVRYAQRIDELLKYITESPHWPLDSKWPPFAILSKEQRPELWVDSLMTLCPFWARTQTAGLTTDGINAATGQLVAYAKFLQEPDSGLWFHAYHLAQQAPRGERWSRGMGWALFGLIEVLQECSADAPEKATLTPVLTSSIEACLQTQDANGIWYTVMDRPDSPPETSGQAMILYALVKAITQQLIDTSLQPQVRAAIHLGWKALLPFVSEQGELTGVTGGTDAGDYAHYISRPTTGWAPWGPAAVLLAASAMSTLEQE